MIGIVNEGIRLSGVEIDRCRSATTVVNMPSREEDYIDNEYYVYNRLFFHLIGLWHGRTSLKNLVYICFINFIIIFGSFEQVSVLVMINIQFLYTIF